MKNIINTRYFFLFLLLLLQVTKFINTGIVYKNMSAGDYVHMVEMLNNMLKKRKESAKITEENTPKPEPKTVKITKKNILKSKPKAVEKTSNSVFECYFSAKTDDLNNHVPKHWYGTNLFYNSN